MSHSNVLSSVYSESPSLCAVGIQVCSPAAKTAHIGPISQPGHVAPLKKICRVKKQVEDWSFPTSRGTSQMYRGRWRRSKSLRVPLWGETSARTSVLYRALSAISMSQQSA